MEAHASPLWSRLPAELHLAVIDLLAPSPASLAALSQTSKSIHALALPALLHRVTLPSFPALLAFLDRLPPAHGTHIHQLTLSTAAPAMAPNEWHLPASTTPRTDALVRLLALTPHLHTLDLRLSGGLAPHAIPAFARLPALRTLALANADDESDCPLSERLVTALALALPALTSLTLRSITRSLAAASDLACPARIPLVANDAPPPEDDDNARPPSPVLPTPDPTLPALLTHPALTHLALHATHLGSPAWALPTLRPAAPLASLALGAHPALPPSQAAAHATGVLRAAERARLRVLELDVGLAGPAVAMRVLEKVVLGPLHPPSAIPSTLGVCGAVPRLEVRAVAEDVVDVCEELGAYLEETEAAVREVRVVCVPGLDGERAEMDADGREAVDALQEVCKARGVHFTLE